MLETPSSLMKMMTGKRIKENDGSPFIQPFCLDLQKVQFHGGSPRRDHPNTKPKRHLESEDHATWHHHKGVCVYIVMKCNGRLNQRSFLQFFFTPIIVIYFVKQCLHICSLNS